MRKLIYGINISIDGCCNHTAFRPTEDTYDYFIRLWDDVDQLVYGRKTYELMFPYWAEVLDDPDATKEELDFAKRITAINKLVFSKTLHSVGDNAQLAQDDLVTEIYKLKQMPGKNISTGGIDLPSQLMAHDLVDEYHFLVHPVLVGKGMHLFDYTSLPENKNLKLIDKKVFDSGAIALHYGKG